MIDSLFAAVLLSAQFIEECPMVSDQLRGSLGHVVSDFRPLLVLPQLAGSFTS